jgi:4-diphosphocytidyl-2-C-methyl-D-erythritol kinase
VNLFLEVTGRRADGFHDIDSVFVEIEMHDTLSACTTPGPGVALACSDASLPVDGQNLVIKAVESLRRRSGVAAGMELRLDKVIPMGSGLGGGSSNAALALRMADALWETRLAPDVLAELAAAIGSDVPFFLSGGACLCRGRGEIVSPLPDFPRATAIVLALPAIHSDTASAYRGLCLPGAGERRTADAFLRAMETGDREAMERAAFNRFEKTIFAALPELGRLHGELEALAGRPVRMSGSGSALWHFADPDYAGSLSGNQALAQWAEQNHVRLVATRAVARPR